MYVRISRHLTGFRSLATAFTIFSLINIMIYTLITLYPPLLESLWLSTDTPWGIITSTFTHADLGHLVSNLQGFTLALLLFIPVVFVHPVDIRKRWGRAFLYMTFGAGIGANLIEYPVNLFVADFNSWGASGIVYGALGVLLAACIRSLPYHLKALPKKRRRRQGFKFDRRFWRGFRAVFVMSLLLAFLISILADTGGFLSVAPGVNVFAHGAGFLIGLMWATVAFRYRHVRKSDLNQT